jgi:hypothetical protein
MLLIKLEYNTSSNNNSQIYSHFEIFGEKENEIYESKKLGQAAKTATEFQT